MEYLHHTSFGVSVLGVLVIVFGVLCGLLRFLRSEILAVRGAGVESERHKLRQALGYYLLLGLEFLIAADIIDTLMKPTTQELIVLGSIVAIRTVISYSLNAELKAEHQHVGRTFLSAGSGDFPVARFPADTTALESAVNRQAGKACPTGRIP